MTNAFDTMSKDQAIPGIGTMEILAEKIKEARCFLEKGALDDAKRILKKILEEHPNSPELQNNLGVIFYRQRYYREALSCFVGALKLKPDYIEAMYNLALVYKALDQEAEAAASLHAIITAEPENRQAHFLLGKMLLEKKRFQEANQHFQEIVKTHPDEIELLTTVIQLLLLHNRYQEAKPYGERLLKLQPQSTEVLYNLGVISARLGQFEKMKNYYHAALQITPTYFPALNNLAICYLAEQNIDAAKYYFEQALKQEPNNEAIEYSLNAISGGGFLKGAPKQYIKNLFDSYADHYEQHLTQGLEYIVPQNLKKTIEEKIKKRQPKWRILDLGCGTGLCGPLFKPWAYELIGVDLSPKMLKMAEEKECYSTLIEAENSEYLSDKKCCFDLILSADVFIYQGDLRHILSACFGALSAGGFLAFSTETNEGEGFALQPTGRFSHAKGYILKLAQDVGFKNIASTIKATRSQRDERLKGHYFLMQK